MMLVFKSWLRITNIYWRHFWVSNRIYISVVSKNTKWTNTIIFWNERSKKSKTYLTWVRMLSVYSHTDSGKICFIQQRSHLPYLLNKYIQLFPSEKIQHIFPKWNDAYQIECIFLCCIFNALFHVKYTLKIFY